MLGTELVQPTPTVPRFACAGAWVRAGLEGEVSLAAAS